MNDHLQTHHLLQNCKDLISSFFFRTEGVSILASKLHVIMFGTDAQQVLTMKFANKSSSFCALIALAPITCTLPRLATTWRRRSHLPSKMAHTSSLSLGCVSYHPLPNVMTPPELVHSLTHFATNILAPANKVMSEVATCPGNPNVERGINIAKELN